MEALETLSVPGNADGIRIAADAFEAFGAAAVPPDVRWQVLVALDEVLSNIVRHGYADHPGSIDLMFSCTDDVVTVTVADWAPMFNPLLAQAPDAPSSLEDQPLGGRGVALMRALVDDVRYERRGEQNRLVFRKKLPTTR